jgi:hypothetical protein
MKIIRNTLFEARLNLPQEYIDKVKSEAEETIGTQGPSHQDMMRMQRLFQEIFGIQGGFEEELTEVGKSVILKFYGSILQGVKLDIKIVDPDDEEKLEMAEEMVAGGKAKPKMPKDFPGIEHDIDKRKLINNVMQGEAQNVHDMMYDIEDEVTEITGNDELLDLYMEFLTLNRKADWDNRNNLKAMMEQMPQMANAMKIEYEAEGDEDEGEEGDNTPVIKVRALDLPMLIHETVKGIYELIAAGAIDPDRERAQKIMEATDTLEDEQEDIKFGPFISRDLRNYVNTIIDKVSGGRDIPNIREFIFGKMIEMPSQDFVKLITSILMGENMAERIIVRFIKEIQEQFREYNLTQLPGYEEEEEDENELVNYARGVSQKVSEPEVEEKPKKWVDMGLKELNYQLNKAIDNEDWTTAKEIQQMIERKGGMSESMKNLYSELFKLVF